MHQYELDRRADTAAADRRPRRGLARPARTSHPTHPSIGIPSHCPPIQYLHAPVHCVCIRTSRSVLMCPALAGPRPPCRSSAAGSAAAAGAAAAPRPRRRRTRCAAASAWVEPLPSVGGRDLVIPSQTSAGLLGGAKRCSSQLWPRTTAANASASTAAASCRAAAAAAAAANAPPPLTAGARCPGHALSRPDAAPPRCAHARRGRVLPRRPRRLRAPRAVAGRIPLGHVLL